MEERWGRKNLELIKDVPWGGPNANGGGDPEAKMEIRIMGKYYAERLAQDQGDNLPEPRRMYLKKEDFELHGYTVDCPWLRLNF